MIFILLAIDYSLGKHFLNCLLEGRKDDIIGFDFIRASAAHSGGSFLLQFLLDFDFFLHNILHIAAKYFPSLGEMVLIVFPYFAADVVFFVLLVYVIAGGILTV